MTLYYKERVTEATLPEHPPPLPAWLHACELAQALASHAGRMLCDAGEPAVSLEPAAKALSRSLAGIYAAIDLRSDRLSELRQATGQLLEAIAALAGAEDDPLVRRAREHLEGARDQLLDAEAELSRQPVQEPPPKPRPLRVGRERIALHLVARASLPPILRVPEPAAPPPVLLPELERPKNVGELQKTMQAVLERAEIRRQARVAPATGRSPDAEPPAIPDGFSPEIEPQETEFAFAQRRLRELFEEVAMLGSQRAPQLGDQWRSLVYLESRLCASVDAAAALGAPALHAVEELVIDSPVKDATRGFAAVVLLGAMEGRDALAAAERAIRFLDAGDPEVFRYAATAFKLSPHPHLTQAMRTMLSDDLPAYRALALEVLADRSLAGGQGATLPELRTLAQDPSAQVACVALRALALGAPRHPDLPTLLVSAAHDPERRAAAWSAMALCGHPGAERSVLEAFADRALSEEAAMPLALVCDHGAAKTLLARVESAPAPRLVEALGWAGAAEALPVLIAVLEGARGDEALSSACAYALDRISGAQLYEEALVDPEAIMIPDVPLPAVDALEPPPLAEEVSDRRDLPSAGSPDTLVRPSTDPARWRAWYQRDKQRFSDGARYRRGHGYTPNVSLMELDGWILTAPERQRLQDELVVRTGRLVWFDPIMFVADQLEALREWANVIASQAHSPGSWSRPSRRA